jgi:hypothetical protein
MTNTDYRIPDLMTVADAALALSVSRSTVYCVRHAILITCSSAS